ncbi:MAG: amidohydrolase family protein [Gemmataceae bacterium]
MSRFAASFSSILLLTISPLLYADTAERPMAFRGATVHPAVGPVIADGVVVVRGGKIVAVGGPDTTIPDGAQVIDVRGKTIIPGLVDSHSHVGIYPRPSVPAHADGNGGPVPFSPASALDAIWPDDPGVRGALAGGVTTANIMPGSGNVIGGQTLYVKFRGHTVEAMRVEAKGVLGGLKMANGENPKGFNFGKNKTPPATRMKLAALQRAEFVKAREYRQKWVDYRQAKAAGKDATAPETDPALDSLVEVLDRKRTVHFHSHRADDLMTALRLAREFDFELVLQHATEGYRIADELARAKVPVSLTLIDSPGGKLETMGLLEENAAILAKAGVLVAVNTDDSITESRFFLRTGAIAVRGGMTDAQALAALTINPARMLHLDHRLGALEVGKDADLVVLSGPPFSVYTQVLQTYVDGRLAFDRARHRDWTYQAGGFAVADADRLPPTPPLVAAPTPVKAPALPDGAKKATAANKRLAVLAGRVYPVSGPPIDDAVVLIDDGKITTIGPRAKVKLPAGVPVLTAAVVTPGLIDAACCVGLSGAANVAADQDQDERTDPNQADIRVLDGFNPDEGLLEFVRREGVTVVHTVPGRVNVVAGQTGVFRTAGATAERMALRTPAGLLVNLGETPKGAYPSKPPTTRMATAALIRAAFIKARASAGKPAGKDRAADARNEALAAALGRKLPVIFAAHRADDILTALRLAKEFDLEARLQLATEGYLVTDELARARVPVLVHPPMQRVGSSMETLNSQLLTAKVLADRKVPVAIGTGYEGYVPKTRVLRHEAAVAAVNGLGVERALAAVTLEAARLVGVADSRGSLEAGKAADLVLYDGDPFEHRTHVTHTLIDGRVVFDRAEYLALPFARRALPLTGAGGVGCCLGAW